MADEHEIEMQIKWQDDVYFELTGRKDSGDKKQIVRIEENGCLEAFSSHIQNICKDYFSKQLHDIFEELKK